MQGLGVDVRDGLRRIAHAPGFSIVAVLVLALGVGATTAIFSAVYSMLLRPLPYPQGGQLMALYEKRPKQGRERNVVSAPDFADWREQSRSFRAMAAYTGWRFLLRGGEPEWIRGALVSGDFFEVLGVRPALRRGFRREDERTQNQLLCVISHALWVRRFHSDPAIVGQPIPLMSWPVTVIGVMPVGFRFTDREAEVWVAQDMLRLNSNRGAHFLSIIGRLRPEATLETARSEVHAIALQLETLHPKNSAHYVNLFPLHDEMVREVKPALGVLLGAVGLVLLIACGNTMNLLLTRGTSRRREVAIRASLGATRGRIARLVLV